MPRPRKFRKIGFIPENIEFITKNKDGEKIELKIEELEAIRLIDLEALDQEQAAYKMGISRGTMQRILNQARIKVADFLINGKKIIIENDNYSINDCTYICSNCNFEYKLNSNSEITCPKCNSLDYYCKTEKEFCNRKCDKFRKIKEVINMPNLDQTGPDGKGPMTGRKLRKM